MFDDLKEKWISDAYNKHHALLLPSVNKQLSTSGLLLDLSSLPTSPIPFKEFFIKWLIMINKDRIAKNQDILITKEIVLRCPLWKVIKCPLRQIKLTKESMFNSPTLSRKSTVGTIKTSPSVGSINKSSR